MAILDEDRGELLINNNVSNAHWACSQA